MKTIVFSDTHLSKRFNPRLYAQLVKIIESADKIVINGDFWDTDKVSFEEFINSEWNKLFPLLKSKNTVYIYGNHDEKDESDDRVNLFSTSQAYELKLELDNTVLHITHGQIPARYINSMHTFVVKIKSGVVNFCISVLYRVLVLVLGDYYFKLAHRKMNNIMIDWRKKNLNKNEILVCGHSHLAEFNLMDGFINLGFNHFGYSKYLMIDGNDLRLVQERY